jgi:hypothetical protein
MRVEVEAPTGQRFQGRAWEKRTSSRREEKIKKDEGVGATVSKTKMREKAY